MHPDHFVDFLQIVRDDRHGCAISERGQDIAAGLFTDERAATLGRADQRNDRCRFCGHRGCRCVGRRQS